MFMLNMYHYIDVLLTQLKKESEILAMVDKSFLSDDARKLYKNTVVDNYKLFRQSTSRTNTDLNV